MPIRKFSHYNIRTTRFDETVAFYRDVLGMKNAVPTGAPDGTPPAWLYDESGEPIVHLMSVDPADPEKDYAARRAGKTNTEKRPPPAFAGSGSIDHIALACEDWDDMVARLRRHDVPYRENQPRVNMRQLFIVDPNGVTLELNFQS
jgi:catechol 2,3-dioxygenase-like lactoylglutathione lyase family enzyme